MSVFVGILMKYMTTVNYFEWENIQQQSKSSGFPPWHPKHRIVWRETTRSAASRAALPTATSPAALLSFNRRFEICSCQGTTEYLFQGELWERRSRRGGNMFSGELSHGYAWGSWNWNVLLEKWGEGTVYGIPREKSTLLMNRQNE